MSPLYWGKSDSKLKEMLAEEHRLNPKNSLMTMTDEICSRYMMPKVELNKILVKRQAKILCKIAIWISHTVRRAG